MEEHWWSQGTGDNTVLFRLESRPVGVIKRTAAGDSQMLKLELEARISQKLNITHRAILGLVERAVDQLN